MKDKWTKTMAVFDEYERRFADARKSIDPELSSHEVIDRVKDVLKFKDELVPVIHNMRIVQSKDCGRYSVDELLFESWEGFYGTASLYVPKVSEKIPLVFLCIGHGKHGRKTESYVQMAHRLVSLGIAVLVTDNIGQGARESQGHWDVVAPFYCGYSVQGLIVMEIAAIIRHMQNDPRFDPTRFGACGNSGGGTLTMFLCALAPELSVISSSGYPSEFSHLFQKERKHCACNLLPSIVSRLDMWQIYSSFSPKPLMLSMGVYDNLFLTDSFKRNCRKVKNTYIQASSENNFEYMFTQTRHSWEKADIEVIGSFLCTHLLGHTPDNEFEYVDDNCADPIIFPENSLNVSELSEKLSGKKMPDGTMLHDVYRPQFCGEILDKNTIIPDVGQGEVMRVFAQMECVLKGGESDA